jgi:hypothetical protein
MAGMQALLLRRECSFVSKLCVNLSDQCSFFHENVGMTAWGLAIHEQSRLIAVSTNLKEVTVFVPALTFKIDESSESVSTASFVKVDAAHKSSPYFRNFNCCRVLKLPSSEGHNMPSIDFSSDPNGEANSVLAIDIEGM